MEVVLEDTQTLKEDLLLICEKLAYQGQECVFLSVNILTEDTFCCGSHFGQEFLMKSSSIVELFMQFCKGKAVSKAISIKTERKEHVSEQENETVKADVICISDSDEDDDEIKEILESVDQDMVSQTECKDFTTSSSKNAKSRIDDCDIKVDVKRDKIDYQQNVSRNILNVLPSSKELSHNSSETMKGFEKEMELFDIVQTYQEVDIFPAPSDVSGQHANQESVKRHKDLINDAESTDIMKLLYENSNIKHNNMSEFGDMKIHENEHIATSEIRDPKLFSNVDEHTRLSEFNETKLHENDEHIEMSEIRETIFPQKGNASNQKIQHHTEDSIDTVNNKTVAGSIQSLAGSAKSPAGSTKSLAGSAKSPAGSTKSPAGNTKNSDFIHIDDGNLESSNNETSVDLIEADCVSSECQNKISLQVETETTIVKSLSVQNVDYPCMTYNASSDSLDNARQSVRVGLNVCENCGECFFSSKLLKIHVTSHCQEVEEENLGKQTREKTQNFSVCEKQFNESDNFLTHLKTHDTMKSASQFNHECAVCSVVFSNKKLFRKHMSIHTDSHAIQSDSPVVQSVSPVVQADSPVVQSDTPVVHSDSLAVPDSPAVQSDDGENKLSQQENSNSKDKSHINSETKNTNSCVNSEKTKIPSKRLQCRYCLKNFRSTSYCNVHENKYCKIRMIKGGIKIPMYHCEQCFREFKTDRYLAVHKKVHCKKRISRETCPSKRRLMRNQVNEEHESNHIPHELTNKKHLNRCTVCSKLFSSKFSLRQHFTRLHRNQTLSSFQRRSLFRCETCSRCFTYKYSLQRHIKCLHKSDNSETNAFTCEICDKSFSYKSSLESHVRHCHMGRNSDKNVYNCKSCDKSFRYKSNLERHERHSHAPGNSDKIAFNCKICDKSFSYKHSLERHKTHIHASGNCDKIVYSCKICDKSFRYKYSFQFHVRRHHTSRNCNKMVYNCKICDKSFNYKCSLKRHERHLHESGNRDKSVFNCKTCDKSFSCKFALQRHAKQQHFAGNSDKKLYSCKTCDKSFSYKHALQRHAKQQHFAGNSDKKLYSCKTCDKSFSYKHALQRHAKQHHFAGNSDKKLYSCKTCDKSFSYKHALQRHAKQHHFAGNSDKKLYSCKTCDKSFSDEYNLQRHVEDLHAKKKFKSLHKKYKCKISSRSYKYQQNSKILHKEHNLTNPNKNKNSTSPIQGDDYHCETCFKCFGNKANLQRHVSILHGYHGNKGSSKSQTFTTPIKEDEYCCGTCFKCFSNKSNLQRHVSLLHGNESSNVIQGEEYRCETCLKCYSNKANLKRHISILHGNHGNKGIRSWKKQSDTDNETKVYTCFICSLEFKEVCFLKMHAKKHIGTTPFQCGLCGFKASDKAEVKLHWKASHSKKKCTPKKYKCYVCYKEFDYYGLFKTHSKKCTSSVMPYQCKMCGKRCSQSNHLSMHLKTHKNVKLQDKVKRKQSTGTSIFKLKTYKCKICGKRCSHINNLNMHLRMHKNKDRMEKAKDESFYLNSDMITRLEEKEKLFECGICNENYSSFGQLKDHLTVHERRKNCYLNTPQMNENDDTIEDSQSKKLEHCHICLKHFNSPTELKSHLKIHAVDKPYKCTICLKTFHNRSVLKWHQATHSNDKSYECKVCHTKVFNFTSWKIHMKLHKKY